MMIFSAHGKVFEKLEFLSSGIFTKEDAESALVMLEPYKDENEAYLQLYTEVGVSCKIYPFNKSESDVLSRSICVKLSELSVIVSQCRTGDFVTFNIDEESNKFIVSSFHNDEIDIDEMEISMNIYPLFDKPITKLNGTKYPKISLDYINFISMMKAFTLDSGNGNALFEIKSGKLITSMESQYIKVNVTLKQMFDEVYSCDDMSVSIPLTSLHMIGSCGHIGSINLTLLNNGVFFESTDYTFFVKSAKSLCHIDEDESKYVDFGVVSSESLLTTVSLLNRINIANECKMMEFVPVDSNSIEVNIDTASMHTSIYLFMAVLSDITIRLDRFMIERLVTDMKTDAIRIKQHDGSILISYEDYTTITKIFM